MDKFIPRPIFQSDVEIIAESEDVDFEKIFHKYQQLSKKLDERIKKIREKN